MFSVNLKIYIFWLPRNNQLQCNSNRPILFTLPDIEIVTVGSSHYKGDIYKDLTSNWIQKVSLDEIVVSETSLPMSANKINSVVERDIVIKNVNKENFLIIKLF